MVYHAGTHDLIEASSKISGLLKGKMVKLKIVEPVLLFQRCSVANAAGAEIDAYDLGCRPTNGIFGRL